jgi:anthranilate phosphoribosyltransferase
VSDASAPVDGVLDQAFETLGRWPGALGRLIAREDLTADEAVCVFGQVLEGRATPAQVAAFVVALRSKGETVEEMAGLVRAMLDHAEPLSIDGDLVDTCGTGGDRSSSVNISTMAAFVLAGAGARVCKHGGRAATSAAGSADVMEALGVVIDLGPEGVRRCVEEAGIGFCLAPRYHPGWRHAAPVRRELGVATVFNFLGPLANPARVRRQVVGVSDPAMVDKMVGVLRANGAEHAMVVHGADGLDELSTTGPSAVVELLATGELRRFVVDPTQFGLPVATLQDLRGSDAVANAAVVHRVLAGEHGAYRDIVVLNAAAAMVVAGLASDLEGGVVLAEGVIDDGRAGRALDALVRVSQSATQ